VSALQPAHEPYRHNGPSRAATVLPWPSGFSPSYMKFGTGSWRNVIVAPRSRKSSPSFEAPAMVSLRELVFVRNQCNCAPSWPCMTAMGQFRKSALVTARSVLSLMSGHRLPGHA
jgi:hypothetical protein